MSSAALQFKRAGRAVHAGTHRSAPLHIISTKHRHLSVEQRELLTEFIARSPEKSDSQLAREIGVNHKAVARARGKGEAAGSIPRVDKRIGLRGRKYPAHISHRSHARPNLIDMAGQVVGLWFVTERTKDGRWSCVCLGCGTPHDVDGSSLRRGMSRSCGCIRKLNLAGRRFDRLRVTQDLGNGRWACVCICGNHVVVTASHLVAGDTRSCGCLRDELTSARFKTHGMSGTREYNSYTSMKGRCFNPNHPSFEWYGARGIGVDPYWLGREGAVNYFADTGERPEDCTLHRPDVNGDYGPANWAWATASEQARNRRPPRRRKRAVVKQLPFDDPPF